MTFSTLRVFAAYLALSGATVVSGCDEKRAPPPTASSAAAEGQPAKRPAATSAAARAVEIAADGTRFEPPVPVSRIPDDTWISDMNGQVHYASKVPGDGKCPVCSMRLVHKGAQGSRPAAGESQQGHDGHEEHHDHE